MSIISDVKMKTRTLNSLFVEHHVPHEFDFLSIDVEGHDLEVLRGLDLTEYRPRSVVIEMRGFSFEDLSSNDTCCHLEERGYQLVAYYSVNGFFLRRDLASGE